MEDLREKIDEALAAFHAGELDKYMSFAAEELEMWPPFGMPVVGKTNCETAVRAMMAASRSKDVTLDDVITTPMGEAWAQVAVMGTSGDGRKFKNLTIWKKEEDEVWRVVKDVWSSADPLKKQ